MRRLNTIVTLAVLMAACGKGNGPEPNPPNPPPGPGPGTSFLPAFLTNTQWVGTFHQTSPGRSYDPPCCLRFRTDDTVVLYSNFAFFNASRTGIDYPDSVKGKIEQIDTYQPGENNFKLRVRYIDNNDVHNINIYQQKTLQSTTTDVNKVNGLQYANLELFPAAGITLSGSVWTAFTGYALPDLTTIGFSKGRGGGDITWYDRNGKIIPYSLDEPEKGRLEVLYVQRGAVVYMNGFNEAAMKLIWYMGVILPSGNEMLVSTHFSAARLPSGGPAGGGATPRLKKLN